MYNVLMKEQYEVREISDSEWNEFVRSHSSCEFTQLVQWAQVKPDWYHRKLAIYRDGVLNSVSLLLFRKLPVIGATLCYAPRGFIGDYGNEADVEAALDAVKIMAKKERAFTLKMDPAVERGFCPGLLTSFEKKGFRHAGFTKGLVDAQPRYTYIVSLEDEEKERVKRFASTARSRIKIAEKLGVVCEESELSGLSEFWRIMQETGERDAIAVRSKAYYENLYRAFSDSGEVHLFLAGVDVAEGVRKAEQELATIAKDRAKFQKKLSATSDENKKKNYEDELSILDERERKTSSRNRYFQQKKEEGKTRIYLSASIMMTCGTKSYYLYGASSDELRELYPSYLLQKVMMNRAKECGATEFDLGGVSGFTEEDPEFAHDDASGLYTFKKQFGGRLVERVGEFNCTLRPLTNALFHLAFTIRKSLRKSKKR